MAAMENLHPLRELRNVIRHARRFALLAGILAACGHLNAAPPRDVATPGVATRDVATPGVATRDPLVFIAFGDTRFTHPSETAATDPHVRRALIDKIAAERPAALFINGDLTWHGVAEDYAAYLAESRPWREQHLPVYPALGNHEFAGCAEAECLNLWWTAFPELRGQRWYSVPLGDRALAIVLDSDASLLAQSDQRAWLEQKLAHVDQRVRLILFVMHHPPVVDGLAGPLGDHNVRPNEQALADYLAAFAGRTRARLLVIAGHIHNYERFDQHGIVYLVSGGGGAKPYPVNRTPADLYTNSEFPNYHYLRFELEGGTLSAQMIRLEPDTIGHGDPWRVADRFELTLPP
jgi:hypothetical protein